MKIAAWVLAGCVVVVLLVVVVFGLIFGGIGYGYIKMNEQPTKDPNAPTPVPEIFITISIPDEQHWELIEPGVCTGSGVAEEIQEGQAVTLGYDNAPESQTYALGQGSDHSNRGDGCTFRTSFELQDFNEVEITIGDLTATCNVSQFSQSGYDVSVDLVITADGGRCANRPALNDPVTPLASPQSIAD